MLTAQRRSVGPKRWSNSTQVAQRTRASRLRGGSRASGWNHAALHGLATGLMRLDLPCHAAVAGSWSGRALLVRSGVVEETSRLWASVYLHDLARRHDGVNRRHGAGSRARLATLPEVMKLYARGGVRDEDCPAIQAAWAEGM